ncbi:N-acetylmuramidase domain-containing protein [uncultured Litoreibacter sp.]|uniref:N-acetylmuramidase domain-containing protein n=1 Tax=uncultured Litoreibacter sp. TaxID=1392394 RepID=UPI00261B11B9|nr:N-acetylmuramidase domain-containing protein [uncultured Litoreibacter sp.]
MAFEPAVMDAINKKADDLGWPARAFAAVVEVESGGKAFSTVNGKRLPLILYEYHVFYRNLPRHQRDEAVDRGLAAPRWGQIPYKKTQSARYAQLDRAKSINSEAAYMACSWGVGQVLGENASWLGFGSARELAETAMSGIEGQLELMVRFIKKRGLVDELKARDWRGFARIYNGSGQVDHYSRLMARAYKRLGGAMPAGSDLEDDVILRLGSKGDAVSGLQQNLRRLGYHLIIDGDFGPATKTQVIAFQRDNGLVPDGIAGPSTLARFEALLGRDVISEL